MANEIDTGSTASELVAAEVVSAFIYEAGYAKTKIAPWVHVEDLRGVPTTVAEVVKFPKLTAAAATDGTDLSNTAVNTTSNTITAAESGIMVTVTDLMLESSRVNIGDWGAELGKSLADLLDTNLAAEFSDAATQVGTSGSDLTETYFLQAIHQLELNNAPEGDGWKAFLHPIQVHDLRTDIKASTGAIWGASAGPDGLVGNPMVLYGVEIVMSTTIPSTDAGANRDGAMGPSGQAFGVAMALKWFARTELERDASLRGTEIVATFAIGDECVDTSLQAICGIQSDHE